MQITVRTNAKKIFQNLARKLDSAKRAAPRILANEGQRFILQNFQREGWRGNVFEKWPKRKNKQNKRSLLIGRTRRLINSLRRSVKEANEKRIKWGTDVPYAAVHNDGETVTRRSRRMEIHFRAKSTNIETRKTHHVFASKTKGRKYMRATHGRIVRVRAYKFKMPRRKYMGASPVLTKILVKKYQDIFHEKLR